MHSTILADRQACCILGIAVRNAMVLPPVSSLRSALLTMYRQGSMASSMVAEATEASVLDSVQDGASSIDDGGSMDGASARCAAGLAIAIHTQS